MPRFMVPRHRITGMRPGPKAVLSTRLQEGASSMKGEMPMPLAAVTAAKRAGSLVLMIVVFTICSPSSL